MMNYISKYLELFCTTSFALLIATSFYGQSDISVIEGGITIDSLTIVNLPSFRAERTVDYTLPFDADTVLLSSNWADDGSAPYGLTFDLADNFDPTSGLFTAPRKGIYDLRSDLIFQSEHAVDDIVHAFISVNGSLLDNCLRGLFTLISGGNTNASDAEIATFTKSFGGIVSLEEGDEVGIYIDFVAQESGFYNFQLVRHTSFSGHLITDLP